MKDMNDAAFESLNWSLFRLLPDLFEDNNGKGARASVIIKFLFLLLLILLIVGSEAVKLIFRRGFGTAGVHWWKAVLCVAIFGGFSYFGISDGRADNPDLLEYGSPNTFLLGGIFYGVLSLYLFYKAFLQKRNHSIESYYRGDSYLFAFLMKSGWSQSRVQNFAEPFTLLSVGAVLAAVNLLWGAPLVFCAISSWCTYIFESISGVSHVRDALANHGYKQTGQGEFSNVDY